MDAARGFDGAWMQRGGLWRVRGLRVTLGGELPGGREQGAVGGRGALSRWQLRTLGAQVLAAVVRDKHDGCLPTDDAHTQLHVCPHPYQPTRPGWAYSYDPPPPKAAFLGVCSNRFCVYANGLLVHNEMKHSFYPSPPAHWHLTPYI